MRIRKSWILFGAGLALALGISVFMQQRPDSASAAFPGSNGKIAFSTNRDGNSEIYVMNADGNNQTRLTNTSTGEYWPSWSPDGAKIAYDGLPWNEQIYVMNADGSNQTRLTNNSARDAQAAWSPDGTKIAFGSNRTGAWQIYVMNADGSAQTQLTTTGNDNLTPSWSPNGTRITFTSTRNGSYDVYAINTDGTGETRLTNGPLNESKADWSPNGTKISYDGTDGIYVMNADGSNKVNVTSQTAGGSFPSWSPDGTKITFQSSRDGNSEIYVMNADGSQQTRLTGTNSTEAMPSWQPTCDEVSCSLPFPIPTPTACPTNGCSPSPPAPTPAPNGLDFSIGADAGLGASNTCNSSGSPTTVCHVPDGANFKVALYLNALPFGLQGNKYAGFDARLLYSGVTQDGTKGSVNFAPWPDCAKQAAAFSPGSVLAGCAVGAGSAGSAYTGRLITVDFHCTADGTITLVHGNSGNTDLVDSGFASFSETGTEALSIDCGAVTVPTPTPGPASVDFSIGTNLSLGSGNTCDSSQAPTHVCHVPEGETFKVGMYLHQLPSGLADGKYKGYDARIEFSGVEQTGANGVDTTAWPACANTGLLLQPGAVFAGCAVGSGSQGSAYTGKLLTIEFRCVQSGEITLIHGSHGVGSDLVDGNLAQFAEPQGSTESLSISCMSPGSYPMDSDGDHCPDTKEMGTNPMLGGERNFLNPWDYFDPTHDGQTRIDDILLVVGRFLRDDSDANPGEAPYAAGYSPSTDRTLLGPNGWNLGPPNGRQRVDDILSAVHQYRHDCS